MIKLLDLLLEKKLADKDINVGDAYHRKTHVGYVVSFVYGKDNYGGWTTIEYQFKPQYGKPEFMGVGFGSAEAINGWGKWPKVKVTSKMKKEMIKTLQDKNSEEVDVLKRNDLRLSNVLSWVKRL
jgi:hypothetical protein